MARFCLCIEQDSCQPTGPAQKLDPDVRPPGLMNKQGGQLSPIPEERSREIDGTLSRHDGQEKDTGAEKLVSQNIRSGQEKPMEPEAEKRRIGKGETSSQTNVVGSESKPRCDVSCIRNEAANRIEQVTGGSEEKPDELAEFFNVTFANGELSTDPIVDVVVELAKEDRLFESARQKIEVIANDKGCKKPPIAMGKFDNMLRTGEKLRQMVKEQGAKLADQTSDESKACITRIAAALTCDESPCREISLFAAKVMMEMTEHWEMIANLGRVFQSAYGSTDVMALFFLYALHKGAFRNGIARVVTTGSVVKDENSAAYSTIVENQGKYNDMVDVWIRNVSSAPESKNEEGATSMISNPGSTQEERT